MDYYDVIIIGAGVVGCLTARALSRYKLRVLLLEKASDVGTGATKANTGIVHAGYNPLPGTNKAKFNVRGNRMYPQLCAELNVPYERQGDYVVALSQEDMRTLEELQDRGRRNGVPGMEIVTGDEVRSAEPALTPQALGALWASTGGIVDPFLITIAAAENAVTNGVRLLLETEALGLIKEEGRIVGVRTNRGTFRCRWVVNCAGIHSDEVMAWAGLDGFAITPRKGEYYVFDKAKSAVKTILFPCPTPISKGIMVTTTTHGNTLIGPNAQNIENKGDRAVTSQGLAEVLEGARRLVPSLDERDVIAVFAGLRPSGSTGDFLIEVHQVGATACGRPGGFVNLAGIESPGLAAAPALAQWVVEALQEHGLEMEEKRDLNPIRPSPPRFNELSREEQAALIERDPRYGRIVCRCEMVTEGEIVRAIHSPVPAHTYDAIKRRTRCGTGRCQGAFDTPRVINILARELGISPLEVTKKGRGSELVLRETREGGDAL
ncbi:MAG: NAD(P)/FAD-dependent oxidoreductase [Chloroflexota bacterium]|nr:NAD(P)/FAD-dependent oxidoreductase [Chloroflexota bacterium]